MNSKYTLRTSEAKDAKFLFHVKIEAMKPTSSISRTALDYDKEFAEYLKKFEPEKIQVIQFAGKDVGRLRIVRSPNSIYIGGIQILPEFQGKGIGTAILKDLIAESETTRIPITLEVHHANKRAISFYKNLGFRENGKTEKQDLMEYRPKSQIA
ncbi:MAG: GNAT family N-acetyltransferase [Candidatus Zambryskibacteria bacterium]|nr:GNAT family N-acetyltransferase [Candidatus Zambryskibacteria bacterium]